MTGLKSLPISVLAGALLVPLSAVASVMLIAPNETPPTQPTGPSSSVPGEAPALSTDLAAACGPAGRELVALDSSSSATDTQRAALVALRPICRAVGMALPEEGATADVTPVVTDPGPVSVETSTTTSSDGPEVEFDDGEYELEYEDGEHEYEYEDGEHEYEYEDGEWEFDD